MPQQANAGHHAAVNADQARIVAENVAPAVLVTLATGVVFAFVHTAHVAMAPLLVWWLVLAAILLARLAVARVYLRRRERVTDHRRWLRVQRAGAVAVGLVWGLGTIPFFPSELMSHQLFTLLVLSGLAAGAISTQAADYRSLVGYDLALLLPISLLLLAEPAPMLEALGALTLVLLAFLLRAGYTLSRSLIDSLHLRHQNQDLLASLAQEKQQLDSRLARILETGSSEIYVFDAGTLACLQVNGGAARHLRCTPDEMLGRSMLTVLADLDRDTFERLVAPLRAGERRSVRYRGEHRRCDGSWYPVDMRLQLSEAEEPPVFVATALDMTEYEATERVARERQALMQSVLSNAPVALWALDLDGNFTFVDGPEILRSPELPAVAAGDNIFECFMDHPQVLHDARRALAGESFHGDLELGSRAFEIHYSPLREGEALVGAIGVALDISDRKAHEHQLYLQASFDALTGLPNKQHLLGEFQRLFARARRRRQQVGLLLLDLDNFKNVNDTLGHAAGDELLKQSAERMRDALRGSDLICRISGDEFLVVVEEIDAPHDVEAIARKLVQAFAAPFAVLKREVYASCSIGISLYPEDGATADELLQHADTAMYQAKSAGRNTFQFFTRSMREAAEQRMRLESYLRKALEYDELSLVFQPKVDAHSGLVQGAEALLRWYSPDLGQVPPDQFIPVAEDAGLIEAIGAWVMAAACREAAGWQSLTDRTISVAVNVSSRQFHSERLLRVVDDALAASGLPAERLELELTEGLLLQDAPETLAILQALRERHIGLALDDFGTGYSSLSYLKRFPLQVLKIDRSFVRDLAVDAHDRALVEAIVAMAHSLGLALVAEGVETAEQADFLTRRGVDLMQGYLFSAPLSAADFRALLGEGDHDRRLPLSAGG